MASIKFKQSYGAVTEGKEYEIIKTFRQEERLTTCYYFIDDSNCESYIEKSDCANTDNFFEIRG